MPVLRRLLVLLAVAGAGFVPAPAMAAGYCSGSGVSVVVDYGALGGGIVKGCDGSGNRNAAQAFENTGHHLTYAQRQPGFVCRVGGVPASDPCVNTSPSDAYWGLYWSDGTSGWKYSSLGAGSLSVPAGATVAFSWQNGGTADPPGTAPAPPAAAPAPAPTKAPTKKATTSTTSTSTTTSTKPRATATSAAPSTTAAPSASAAASARASAAASASASAAAPAAPATTTDPSPTDAPSAAAAGPLESRAVADRSGGGLPWFVPAGVLVLLAGGAGGATWWRRRTTG